MSGLLTATPFDVDTLCRKIHPGNFPKKHCSNIELTLGLLSIVTTGNSNADKQTGCSSCTTTTNHSIFVYERERQKLRPPTSNCHLLISKQAVHRKSGYSTIHVPVTSTVRVDCNTIVLQLLRSLVTTVVQATT